MLGYDRISVHLFSLPFLVFPNPPFLSHLSLLLIADLITDKTQLYQVVLQSLSPSYFLLCPLLYCFSFISVSVSLPFSFLLPILSLSQKEKPCNRKINGCIRRQMLPRYQLTGGIHQEHLKSMVENNNDHEMV